MAILWYFNVSSLITATQPMQLLLGFVMHVLERGLTELPKRELHERPVAADAPLYWNLVCYYSS